MSTASRTSVAVVALLVTFAAGLATGAAISSRRSEQRAFVVSRAGPNRLTNPILECNVAEEVLANRELASFKEKVEAVLAGQLHGHPGWSAAVYFRALNDGIWFSIGDTERYTPASLRKLPMMLAILKMAEGAGGRAALARQVPNLLSRDYDEQQNIKPSVRLEPGRSYTVEELIRRMIAYSDNNAFMLLSGLVDPAELSRVYALLRLERPGEDVDGRYQSVRTVASVLRILYNASYVGTELSGLALEMLAQSDFRTGLVAGVPAGVAVAHKFGEMKGDPPGTAQLHDCGIVYFPGNPYLLCVLTRGTEFPPLDDLIALVSRTVYREVDAQARAADAGSAVIGGPSSR